MARTKSSIYQKWMKEREKTRKSQLAKKLNLEISNGDPMTAVGINGITGNTPKERSRDYADSQLINAETARVKGNDSQISKYLRFARNNGASLKTAKARGFSNAQLRAAGYSIG